MTLPDRTWRNLPVETVMGTPVGKLVGAELDSESHRVVFYQVRRKRLVPSGPDLLISPSQVVSLTNEKMVVEDLHAPDSGATNRKPSLAPASPVMPVAQS